jgi:hypothetical protein
MTLPRVHVTSDSSRADFVEGGALPETNASFLQFTLTSTAEYCY